MGDLLRILALDAALDVILALLVVAASFFGPTGLGWVIFGFVLIDFGTFNLLIWFWETPSMPSVALAGGAAVAVWPFVLAFPNSAFSAQFLLWLFFCALAISAWKWRELRLRRAESDALGEQWRSRDIGRGGR